MKKFLLLIGVISMLSGCLFWPYDYERGGHSGADRGRHADHDDHGHGSRDGGRGGRGD
jgi:hypothetical protein